MDVDASLLSWVIFLPGGVAVALLVADGLLQLFLRSSLSAQIWKLVALGTSLLGFALSVGVWLRFDPAAAGIQMVERAEWLPDYGIWYYVGIDGISLLLVMLTAFLLPVILLASWNEIATRSKQYVFFMLGLQTGMLGAFLSLNLFLYYMFWEVMLITIYFINGIWGGPRRI